MPATKTMSDIDRFHRNYIKNHDGCWLWSLKPKKTGLPYGQFTIGSRKNNSVKTVSPHRWIWQQINGEIPAGLFVCHHCDVPQCVNPSHLFIGTAKDNAQDRDRKGRAADRNGIKSPCAKLSERDVVDIKQSYVSGETQLSIANKYSISQAQVYRIIHNKRWKSLQLPEIENLESIAKSRRVSTGMKRKGTAHPMCRLSQDDVINIRNLASRGFTQRAIALKYNIAQPYVSKIIRRERWSHI